MTVYKMIDVVGTSGTSIDDAVRGAIQRASATVDDLGWFEVKEIRGRVTGGTAAEFQVKLSLGFVVHAPRDLRRTARREKTAHATRQNRSAAAQLLAGKGGRKAAGVARGFKARAG